MDTLTEWYSNLENIKRVSTYLKKFIYVNGMFKTQDDVNFTIEDAIWDAYSNLYGKYNMKNLVNCKPKTIIYKAAKNNALSEIRKRKRRLRISLSAEKDYNSNNDITLMLINEVNPRFYLHLIPYPDKYAEINELKKILNNSIDELPEKYKEPFLLWTQGYTYNEMSDILKKPVGTVKSSVYRARKELKSDGCIRKHHELYSKQ